MIQPREVNFLCGAETGGSLGIGVQTVQAKQQSPADLVNKTFSPTPEKSKMETDKDLMLTSDPIYAQAHIYM